MVTARRPTRSAAKMVVPEPQNVSSTMSPRRVQSLMASATSATGLTVGWLCVTKTRSALIRGGNHLTLDRLSFEANEAPNRQFAAQLSKPLGRAEEVFLKLNARRAGDQRRAKIAICGFLWLRLFNSSRSSRTAPRRRCS
jgi:hypothetical protein